MNRLLATLIPVLLASLQLSAQQSSTSNQANTGAAPSTHHIEGKGCLKPGRQNGCLVVNDIKAHRKYNLFFDGKNQPELNTAISFEGIGYQHVSHCNQGQKVQVTDWKALPGNCPQPDDPKIKPN